MQNTIPQDILKIQKKLATFEKDSRKYKKYTKKLFCGKISDRRQPEMTASVTQY